MSLHVFPLAAYIKSLYPIQCCCVKEVTASLLANMQSNIVSSVCWISVQGEFTGLTFPGSLSKTHPSAFNKLEANL